MPTFRNNKKKHHFVSQAEQRLNAIDKSIKKKNQKIYSFSILDRERFEISLDDSEGVLISENLQDEDLFTLHVFDEQFRENYEDFFNRFENEAGPNTETFLKKLDKGKEILTREIFEILKLKFLNFFRNPYSYRKALNTFGNLSKYCPTDQQLREHFRKIDKIDENQIYRISSKYQMIPDDYKEWMKCIFHLVANGDKHGNRILDIIISEIFDVNTRISKMFVYTYPDSSDDTNILLSDRGFTSDQDESGFCFQFNLNATSFINICVVNIESSIKQYTSGNHTSAISHFIRANNDSLQIIVPDDSSRKALSAYNQRVVYQSFKKVFSKSDGGITGVYCARPS